MFVCAGSVCNTCSFRKWYGNAAVGASEKKQPVSFVSAMSSGAAVIAAVIARDIRPRLTSP